jgi:glycosyltransferase involved in cell wall biosynthesis
LARFLSHRKVPTTVFCGKSGRVEQEQVNDYLTIIRLPLLDLPLRAFWFQIRNSSLLRKELSKFDLVHALNPQSSAVCAFVKPKNLPLLTTVHDVPVFRSKAFFNAPVSDWSLLDFMSNSVELPVNYLLYSSCFARCEKIVAVSRSVAREVVTAFPNLDDKKVTVIHCSIDLDRVRAETPAELPQARSSYILFYGRHIAVKGIALLLRAISELRDAFPAVDLKIAGNGPQSEGLHKLARELKVLRNVHFLGRVQELIPLIMRSSFVVLPSSYEACPGAVLEAMACGKAVIALDYPFSREIIDDSQTGLLTKPGNAHDLANKIELLIREEGFRRRLGESALHHVHRYFNWDNTVDSYVNLYRELSRC